MWILVIIIGLPLIWILLIPWCSLVVFLTWKSFDAFDRDSALTWQNSRQSEQGRNLLHYLRNPWISRKKIMKLWNEQSLISTFLTLHQSTYRHALMITWDPVDDLRSTWRVTTSSATFEEAPSLTSIPGMMLRSSP